MLPRQRAIGHADDLGADRLREQHDEQPERREQAVGRTPGRGAGERAGIRPGVHAYSSRNRWRNRLRRERWAIRDVGNVHHVRGLTWLGAQLLQHHIDRAFARRMWGDAFADLSAAQRERKLDAEDLERLVGAAIQQRTGLPVDLGSRSGLTSP